jgi:hypothetical protein
MDDIDLGNGSRVTELYETVSLIEQTDLWANFSQDDFTQLCQRLVRADLDTPKYWSDDANSIVWKEWESRVLRLGHIEKRAWYLFKLNGQPNNPRTGIGIAADLARKGDRITVLQGCSLPVLLRKRQDAPGTYTYHHETYIPGFMHGEAVEDLSRCFDEIMFEIF